MCYLICVDPARVHEFWPHVRELIRQAMRRGDIGAFAPVEASVLGGEALLWLAWNPGSGAGTGPGAGTAAGGGHIEAAAVTELHETDRRRVCVIVACGAEDGRRRTDDRDSSALCRRSSAVRAAWLPLIAGIEHYARAERCSAVRIIGRKGWIRILTAYRPKRVVLEKELD